MREVRPRFEREHRDAATFAEPTPHREHRVERVRRHHAIRLHAIENARSDAHGQQRVPHVRALRRPLDVVEQIEGSPSSREQKLVTSDAPDGDAVDLERAERRVRGVRNERVDLRLVAVIDVGGERRRVKAECDVERARILLAVGAHRALFPSLSACETWFALMTTQ